jgi:hypothetical protein
MRQPKVNEVTHICCLITGDRFYCCSDDRKEVWELRFHTLIKTKNGMKKYSQCRNDRGERYRFDANRMVVFLRRTKHPVKRNNEFSIDKYFA